MFSGGSMAKLRLALVIATVLLPSSSVAQPVQPRWKKIVAFGDSLTDSYAAYRLTLGLLPPSYPQFEDEIYDKDVPFSPTGRGRQTNGLTWIEYLKRLGKVPKLDNYAFIGARAFAGTDDGSVVIPSPQVATLTARGFTDAVNYVDLDAQVARYTAKGIDTADTTVHIIDIGGGEILNLFFALAGGLITTTQFATYAPLLPSLMVAEVAQQVQALLVGGARNVAVLSIEEEVFPRLKLLQKCVPSPLIDLPALQVAVAKAYNYGVKLALQQLDVAFPQARVKYVSTAGFFESMLTDKSITNFDDPCFDAGDVCRGSYEPTLCSKPRQYFFYDATHPSTYVHKKFAEFLFDQIPARVHV